MVEQQACFLVQQPVGAQHQIEDVVREAGLLAHVRQVVGHVAEHGVGGNLVLGRPRGQKQLDVAGFEGAQSALAGAPAVRGGGVVDDLPLEEADLAAGQHEEDGQLLPAFTPPDVDDGADVAVLASDELELVEHE